MDFVFTDNLRDYMGEKGHEYILISINTPHTWTGRPKLVSSFIPPKLAESMRKRNFFELATDAGSVFIGSPRIDFDEVVTLDVIRFADLAELVVTGARLL